MSGFIGVKNRQQSTLFPERVGDYIGEYSPVWVIDYFIDKLNIFRVADRETGPGLQDHRRLQVGFLKSRALI